MLRGMVESAIRKEMKQRVDQLLEAQKEANKHMDRLAKAIEDFPGKLNEDVQQAVGAIMKASEDWARAAETTRQASTNLEKTLDKVSKELS